MTELHGIAYVSSAYRVLSVAELEQMLVAARRFNTHAGVTGVLLHHDGGFFQYFEGPSEGALDVYERIKQSPLHHSIIELLNEPVPERAFPTWMMGSTRVPASTVLSLRLAPWRDVRGRLARAEAQVPVGLDLLRSYWATLGVR